MNKIELEKNTILVVDDNPDNLDILIDSLENFCFTIFVAQSGEEAIKLAEKVFPDIILLDVIIPGINGFETCRRLKKNENTGKIPVIFMTALSDTVNKVKGFDVGGVDYVTKPFQHEDIFARIRAHLTICHQQKQLEQQNQELIKINQEKNEFIGIVSHDLKNPLNGIIGVAKLIYKNPDSSEKWAALIENIGMKMLNLLSELLDINRLELGKSNLSLQEIELPSLVLESVFYYCNDAEKKQIQLCFDFPDEEFNVYADQRATAQIFDNLISNAVKYSPYGKNVNIRLFQNENFVRCEVEDEGQGLIEDDQQKIFGKFARLSAKPTGGESSTGLGLSIVKKFVELMNGHVWVESEGKDRGSIFIVELPKYGKAL